MGVDVQAFVILGVKLPFSAGGEDAYDRLEPYICGAPEAKDFQVVYDGMGGNYIIAGKRLAASDQADGHFQDPIEVRGVGPSECAEIEAKIKELFPNQPAQGLSLIVVSHYS